MACHYAVHIIGLHTHVPPSHPPTHAPQSTIFTRVINVEKLQNIQIVRKQFILHRYEYNNITVTTTAREQ